MFATRDASTKAGAFEGGSPERSGNDFRKAGLGSVVMMCQEWGDEDEIRIVT